MNDKILTPHEDEVERAVYGGILSVLDQLIQDEWTRRDEEQRQQNQPTEALSCSN